MPNWCQNEVKVYLDEDGELERFKEFVAGPDSEFSFESIVPMPYVLHTITVGSDMAWWGENSSGPELTKEDKENLKKEHGTYSWYDWALGHWGTKWDACDVSIEEEDECEIMYRFETAWTPPTPIYEALVKKFPNASISWFYREDGMQYAGYMGSSR